MSNIFVFWGPAGCGKTTLISKLKDIFLDYKHFDLVDYYRVYKGSDGEVPLECKIKAFEQSINDLSENNSNVFFEVGTSFQEVKVEKLANLSLTKKVVHLLCLLDEEECLRRAQERQDTDPAWTPSKALAKRYKKGYPKNHEGELKKFGQRYMYLDMNDDKHLENASGIIENIE